MTFDGLRSLAAEAGFDEVDQWHRGSHSYLLVERPLEPSPDVPPLRSLDERRLLIVGWDCLGAEILSPPRWTRCRTCERW